jgi:DNA-directed RNA polymerase specialized sigma24 family protein
MARSAAQVSLAPALLRVVRCDPHVGAKSTRMDDDELELWVERAVLGDELAWQRLWTAVEPRLAQLLARPHFLGRLATLEDDRRNVVVEVMARLRANGFHRLRLYLDARRGSPTLRFMAWLRVVAKRVGIDYMRGHPDYVDRRRQADASSPGRWIQVGTMPPDSVLGGDRPPVTSRSTAGELLRYADGAMPPAQKHALELWVACEPYEDIARAVGLATAAEAERSVRAAIERLRRRFRDGDKKP